MKHDAILEEVWRIKDDLAREADGDIHTMCVNARKWLAAHPHAGPVARSVKQLRQLVAAAEHSALAVREKPPRYGKIQKS